MTKQEFSQIMKQFREHRKFTQAEAAAHLGVSVRTLQNWEIARNMPEGFGLRAILKTLQVPAIARKSLQLATDRGDATAPNSFTGSLETHLL